ncbi:DUF1217 domain-containing protein [Aquabacter spiritensis]|uniref:Uncharacterized protein DUF1217 n=1 Tax=Aquabacter spiritensis TaxID=933073 RepID=A0A4R3M4H8_9HYPH|nr:DUF1217 domain-containing protein [Aquabacter spiritensis]TCT07942.1 uncharacterized protein DUF1217 [Aquabacter spiritensis]
MDTTFATYQTLTRNLGRTLALKQAEPVVALETKYYLAHIKDIKNVDALVRNTRVFTYAMKAFGLEDMTYAKAYMRKVLNEGVSDPKSFANRLNDDRFLNFAKTFNFKEYGALTTTRAAAGQDVVDKYVRQSLEVDQGADNDGVRLALYFKRAAPGVKSAYGLLADPALWKVAKTVFRFPDAMGNAAIERQADIVKKALNIADLQDPAKVDRLIQRFTVMWDATQGTSYSPVLDLFASRSSSGSLGLNTSMSLINLRYGG